MGPASVSMRMKQTPVRKTMTPRSGPYTETIRQPQATGSAFALSALGHVLLFSALLLVPGLSPEKTYSPSVISVSMVTLPSAAPPDGAEAVAPVEPEPAPPPPKTAPDPPKPVPKPVAPLPDPAPRPPAAEAPEKVSLAPTQKAVAQTQDIPQTQDLHT